MENRREVPARGPNRRPSQAVQELPRTYAKIRYLEFPENVCNRYVLMSVPSYLPLHFLLYFFSTFGFL